MDTGEAEEFRLPYLETFATAAELSSFTAAANALRLTQAAVSQRVHALEKTLGKPLFERKGGRVVLSEAGQTLYGYAQQILELQRQARLEITGQESPLTGELLLAASSIPGEYLLPPLLSLFAQQYPHVQVRVTVTDSMSVMEQVERGEASLGIAGRKANNPHLEFHYFASDRMVLIVPPGHPLSRPKKVSLADLVGYAIVLRESGSGLRNSLEQSLEQAGRSISELTVALELGSNEGIKQAVLQGAGVAILSCYAVQKERRSGSLLALDVCDLQCDRDFFIVHDRRRVLPRPARLFNTFLESHPVPEFTP